MAVTVNGEFGSLYGSNECTGKARLLMRSKTADFNTGGNTTASFLQSEEADQPKSNIFNENSNGGKLFPQVK